MSHVQEFTTGTWGDDVESHDGAVLVDFWAVWCGPCRMVAPVVEELAKEYGDRLKVGKVNVDDNNDLAQRYGIRSIPTIMIFKGGEVAQTVVGAVPKARLQAVIDEVLS